MSNEKKGPNGCLFRVYVGDEKSYPVLCGWITSLNNQDFKESKAVFFSVAQLKFCWESILAHDFVHKMSMRCFFFNHGNLRGPPFRFQEKSPEQDFFGRFIVFRE